MTSRIICCGVGYDSGGVYIRSFKGVQSLAYVKWAGMLDRCYSGRVRWENSYKGVSVCEEWHDFQSFASWFYDLYSTGFELDKDILANGRLEYSPETCCLIPPTINKVLINHRCKGYTRERGRFRVQLRSYGKNTHIGRYDTEEEAISAYRTAKASHLRDVADDSYTRGEINEEVHIALCNWEF